MLKKIGTASVLSATLLFGGAFTASADTQPNVQKEVQYKVHYSINGAQGQLQGTEAQELINKVVHQWKDSGKLDWLNVEELSKTPTAQPAEEQPKQETEAPAKEQPAEEKEQPKQEQPKEVNQPEAAPQPQQPQQPQQEQPKQEETQSEQLNQFEQEVVQLTNDERVKQGLAPLEADAELSKVAREKSRDMATNNYFSHNSPTYGSPFEMMNQFGISYKTAGENIAQGQTTPQQVVDAWMNSDGHRANILNGDYTHIGVGFVENGNHWTQMFIGK